MSTVAKVIELISESDKSWDDAAKNAIVEASKTVKNIKSLYVNHFEAVVAKNRIVQYRVNANITFEVE